MQWIHVDAHDDIPAHEVSFFENEEWTIARLCRGRDTDDLVFPTLPLLDYATLRESYAAILFIVRYEGIGSLDGAGSLREVGQQVKQALGLPRQDATLRARLRWARRERKKMRG